MEYEAFVVVNLNMRAYCKQMSLNVWLPRLRNVDFISFYRRWMRKLMA